MPGFINRATRPDPCWSVVVCGNGREIYRLNVEDRPRDTQCRWVSIQKVKLNGTPGHDKSKIETRQLNSVVQNLVGPPGFEPGTNRL
jgi:hypothetical protein